MSDTVQKLALAYYFTQNETYAAGAAATLRAWFVEPTSMMNPNMAFAANVPGGANGSSSGLIATTFRWAAKVTDSEVLLRGSLHWSLEESAVFQAWNRNYLQWLLTSKPANREANATNNHFTWMEVQALALALSTGNDTIAEELAGRIRSPQRQGCLQKQINSSGVMPKEAHRVGGATYSCMNTNALFNLATVASHTRAGTGLWTWEEPGMGTGSIRNALDYLLLFATNESKPWPWTQEGAHQWADFPWNGLKVQMRIASIVYRDERYEDAIAKLPWAGGWKNGTEWAADVAQLLWPKDLPSA
jgi:hypothetical protein